MISREENKILKRAAQGDETSLSNLVIAYRDLAYTIALKIVLNHEDAEEVVQDAFLKAFSALGNFREASKFSTWLYRIVYNTAITKARSKKTAGFPTLANLWDAPNSSIPPLEEDILGKKERKKYVTLALDRLSPDDRLILMLYYVAEKKVVEIGEIMNLKISAVKMRLLRGRKQVEAELEQLLGTEIKDLYEP